MASFSRTKSSAAMSRSPVAGVLGQLPQVLMHLRLEFHQQAPQDFLPQGRGLLQAVRDDVIDIFDIYQVALDFPQVLQKRAMAARAEYQMPLAVPERVVVGICSQGVGAGMLKRKGYVQAAVEAFLQSRPNPVQETLKDLAVAGNNGQVDPAQPVSIPDVARGLHQVFLNGVRHSGP